MPGLKWYQTLSAKRKDPSINQQSCESGSECPKAAAATAMVAIAAIAAVVMVFTGTLLLVRLVDTGLITESGTCLDGSTLVSALSAGCNMAGRFPRAKDQAQQN